MISVQDICRYPVKGLSADRLERVTLLPGAGVPLDRKWGLIHAASAVDPFAPSWAAKKNFLMLARKSDTRLAELDIAFDEDTTALSILRRGREVSRGRLNSQAGQQTLQTFLAAFLNLRGHAMPRIVKAPAGNEFTDRQERFISLINLEMVRDLEQRVLRTPVHPQRFRGNFYLSGISPRIEKNWIGRHLQLGGAMIEVVEPITRCAATNVNPETGAVDMNIPLALRRAYGMPQMGFFAKVVKGGVVAVRDNVTLL